MKAKDILAGEAVLRNQETGLIVVSACPVLWNEGWPQSYFSVMAARLHIQHLSEHPEIRCECK